MNEEDFIKEHPSLKGKIEYPVGINQDYKEGKFGGHHPFFDIVDIQETQLDKTIVREAIKPLSSELKKHIHVNGTITISAPMVKIILERLKELGLE